MKHIHSNYAANFSVISLEASNLGSGLDIAVRRFRCQGEKVRRSCAAAAQDDICWGMLRRQTASGKMPDAYHRQDADVTDAGATD